jgi:NAD-dependent SIR2 family protein deacetylase
MYQDSLQNFRETVAKSEHIIVVAGAGLSAASGLLT